jgi:oligopeptidase A
MPEELFSRIVRAQNFRRASFYLRQLSFGTLDLKLHREYNREKDGDILEYCREHLKAYSPAPLPQEYAWICSFTHVFGGAVGYAAGYYSYLWAEVIEADAFSRFHREGVLNRTTGLLLREKILSRGDSVDPSQMVRDFLGRDPQSDALLTRAGLT